MSSLPAFPLLRRSLLSLAALALIVLAAAVLSASASAAPAVTLTHDPDLNANPTVGVAGTGWSPPGLYVAQVAVVGDEVIVGSSQKWVRPGAPMSPNQAELMGDGTFNTNIVAAREIGTAPNNVDCAVEKCFIATWPQHSNPTPGSIFTKNRLYFAPEVNVNPDTGIAASGQTLAVNGGGIPASYVTGKGIIVSQVAVVDGAIKTPGPGSAGVSRYIRASGTGANKLNADGTFNSDLTLSSTFTDSSSATIDCMEVQCEVAVWEGQSFPAGEGSLLARTNISFGTIAVSPDSDLSVLGQNVSVEGTSFDPIDFPVGVKVSLGLVDGSNVWLNDVVDVTLEGDGSFEAEVPVAGLFLKPGQHQSSASAAVDCIVLQCSILVWDGDTAAPTPADVIAANPVGFQRPSLTATPATGLDQGQTVAITGSGFSPAGTGVYVSQVALIDGEIVTPPPVSPNIMQWIRAASLGGSGITLLGANGSFETPIVVSRAFKADSGATIDCMVEQCEIIAWRGHTMPTPESIYASASLVFDPPTKKPDVVPPVDPAPPVTTPPPPSVRPSATVSKQKQFKLGTSAASLNMLTVQCGSAACSFQKPKRVSVTIGERKLWLAVTGPKRAVAGKAAKFGVRVSARAAKQLSGHRGRVKFKVEASSDSGKRTITIDKLLIGSPR